MANHLPAEYFLGIPFRIGLGYNEGANREIGVPGSINL